MLPDSFELDAYRACWPDLAGLSPSQLRAHYQASGIAEGRRANSLTDRNEFAALIPKESEALEIGPFFRPLLKGPKAKFFDVLTTAELRDRAAKLGLDLSAVPTIDYVSPAGDLSIVDALFDNVISSHCIEHQPDLITHINHVGRMLRAGGRYFLLVPDKRYCFDALLPPSTIADVLDAYAERRRTHTLRSVIEHRALTTHNNRGEHWIGNHGSNLPDQSTRVRAALDEFHAACGRYIDVHAWQFTPESITLLLNSLCQLGLIQFTVERLYPTRVGSDEFWLVLQKS